MNENQGTPINSEMLAGNTCFGCSLTNPEGLQIRIYRDGERMDRLLGTYTPRVTHSGFPQIVHGGLQFSALDCMAGWIVFGLRGAERKMPLTQSAQIRFRRPARIDQPLSLSSEIVSTELIEDGPKTKELLQIHTEIRDLDDELLSIADFEYVAIPEARFRKVVGIDELPETYRKHFGDV